MRSKTLAATAVLVAAAAGSAASAAPIYATGIDWTNNGTVGSANDRDNPLNGLGAPDSAFFSLGLGGHADFTFGQTFTGPGASYEVTFGNRSGYLETAEVRVGASGTFTSLGQINNASAAGFVFGFSGVFDTLRLVDTTPGSSRSTDGYDVDAVSVTGVPEGSIPPVPLPPSALLLAAGLVGIGALRARRAKG